LMNVRAERHQPPHHRQVLVHDGHVQHALTCYMKNKLSCI
jgi:hypothetical protein